MLASPEVGGSFDALTKAVVKTKAEKIRQLTGSEDALAFHNAVQAQAHLPWYLRPTYGSEIKLDSEGLVKTGSLTALVEKLTSAGDPLSKILDTTATGLSLTSMPSEMAQETVFRNTFLMTFRTFTSPDQFFDLLVERYRMDHPPDLTGSEFEEWKDKKLLPTQKRVLTILTMWLEDHDLLEEEPYIAQRLTDFLTLIISPPPLALTAKLMLQSLERLVRLFTKFVMQESSDV